jgi:hypothetical protein
MDLLSHLVVQVMRFKLGFCNLICRVIGKEMQAPSSAICQLMAGNPL